MQTSLRSNYQYYDHGSSSRHISGHYQPLVTDNNNLPQAYGTHLIVAHNEASYDAAEHQSLNHQLGVTCYASELERSNPQTDPTEEQQSNLIIHHQYDHYQALENAVLVTQPILAQDNNNHVEGLYQHQDQHQLLFNQHQANQPTYPTIYYDTVGYSNENCTIERVAALNSGQQNQFGENVVGNLCELDQQQQQPRSQQQVEEQQSQEHYHPFATQQVVEEQQTLQQSLLSQSRQLFENPNVNEQNQIQNNQTPSTSYQTPEVTSVHELVRLSGEHERAESLDIHRFHHHPQLQHHHHPSHQQQPLQEYVSKDNFVADTGCFSAVELINNRSLESHSSALSTSSSEESSGSTLTRDEKRAREASIPLTYHEIVNLTIDQFNEQLAKHSLTESQLTLIKDIRRRGKNKVAAQSCRKRKMEQINELQHEVNHLANKRRILTSELNQWNEKHTKLAETYKTLYTIIQEHMRKQT